MRIAPLFRLVILLLVAATLAAPAMAQELEPRLFQNLPVGANIATLALGYSRGNVLFDSTLPIEDANAKLFIAALAYVRALNVGGLSGRIEATLPYATGHWEGLVNGQFAETDRSGFADARIRFAVNFSGAPALKGRDYFGYRQKTIWGASLQLFIPTGEYDGTRLINLGTNRWAVRPQIGFSRAVGAWAFEGAATAWLYGDNDDANGQTLSQDPVYALQGHVLYRLKKGIAFSLSAGFADGGKATVGTEERSSLKNNSRIGVTMSLPLGKRDGLSFVYTNRLAAAVGSDFDTYGVSYRYLWGV